MINRVTLVGRVGSDPEIKVTSKDEKFAKLSLATNKKYKVGGDTQEKTAWHMIKVFDPRLAETIEKYVKKGTTLYVEGEIDYSKFTEIVVPKFSGVIRMLGSKSSASSKPAAVKQAEEEEVVVPF